MVRKFEHWGTTFVSPQRGGCCRLNSSQRHRRGKVQGHRPRRGIRRTPRELGSTEPAPPLPPPPPAAVATASAKPSFGYPRRCSQHVGPSRCCLGTNTDRARYKGSGSGAGCGRLAQTQIVEAEAAATEVPPEAREGLRETSPDTLCATGSLTPPTKSPPPFQTDFRVWLPPFPHPRRRDPPVLAASSFRLPASQHAPRDPAPSQSS